MVRRKTSARRRNVSFNVPTLQRADLSRPSPFSTEPSYIHASYELDAEKPVAVLREIVASEGAEQTGIQATVFPRTVEEAVKNADGRTEVFIIHNAQGAYVMRGRVNHLREGFYEDNRLTVFLGKKDGFRCRIEVDMGDYRTAVLWCKLVEKKAACMVFDEERATVKFCAVLGEDRPEWHGVLGWILGRERARVWGKEWVLEQVRRRSSDLDWGEQYLEKVRAEKGLSVHLRPYQERAVAWMLERELGEEVRLFKDEELQVGELEGVKGVKKVFVNVLEGVLRAQKRHGEVHGSGRGGLLCDEMGLGKTVELMQLVLCNRADGVQWSGASDRKWCSECGGRVNVNDKSGNARGMQCLDCGCVTHKTCMGERAMDAKLYGYVCIDCFDLMQELVKDGTSPEKLPRSKATVVVIPTALLLQWQEEIRRHCGEAMKIVIFCGLKRSGYIGRKVLTEADIVLTTYDALRADVDSYRALKTPREGLRNRKRYRPMPMPLVTMRWHRLALDESQMLGSHGTSQAAEMASCLHATYRWCVTGTPMKYSVNSLRPMLDMLRIQTEAHEMDWPALISGEVWADENTVRECLRKVMWRTEKRDVADELGLPPQVREVLTIAFGPVERYHYQSLQKSVKTAMARQRGDGANADVVSRDLLTMLRQACCHPQIGVSGRRLMSRAARQVLGRIEYTTQGDDAVSKAAKRAEEPLDMNDVLRALVTKAKMECEEALRVLVGASNGLAAVLWLQHSGEGSAEGVAQAVKIYRRTLGMVEENRTVVRLDNIQRMHILFNLKEALDEVTRIRARGRTSAKLNDVGYTLRDGNLEKEVDQLKSEYVAEAEATLVAARESYKETYEKLGDEPLFVEEAEEDETDEESDRIEGENVMRDRGRHDGENVMVDEDRDDEELEKTDEPVPPKRKRVERPWWRLALGAIYELDHKKQEAFLNRTVKRLIEALPGGGVNTPTLANRLNSVISFPLVVESELRELQRSRCKLREDIFKLPGAVRPTPSDVAESGQCRECREFGIAPACIHCRSERLFTEVERRLYYINEEEDALNSLLDREESSSSTANQDPNMMLHGAFHSKVKIAGRVGQNSGLRYHSEVENILKAMAGPLRAKGDDVLNKKIADWFAKFETMKKEHAEARRFFEAQRSLLAAMDEVNMALMRFSVLEDGEDINTLSEDQKRHRLPKSSLPSLNVQFSNEKVVAEADFKTKRGSLVYLTSLQKSSQRGKNDTSAGAQNSKQSRNCAVCLSDFDDTVSRVAVFVCGHVFCCDCTLMMIKKADVRSHVSSVMCPSCRVKCPVDEINFTINGSAPEETSETEIEGSSESAGEKENEGSEDDDFVPVDGTKKRARGNTNTGSRKARKIRESPSTFHDVSATVVGLIGAKASAVVRTLRGIWAKNSSSKILVFSEWLEVLRLLSKALEMNEIHHLSGELTSSAAFASVIKKFKTSILHNVILLPLRRAGAGLNLTEAEHVILMEPSMDVSLELQATGRVHRIGQERVTYVHRMIVKETVEDTILALGDEFRGGTAAMEQKTIQLSEVIGSIKSTADGDAPVIEIDGGGEGMS